jgi:hypothetical protein
MSRRHYCEVLSDPPYEPCGNEPTRIITFGDGQRAYACAACALHLQQIAQVHNTQISVMVVRCSMR